ncbi:bifunctional nicotinamidase/pyrazinamidase [Cyclobacterium marinum]|uniref:Nicotinamidase n=1 Tax=Cyclobacterium marinum (strain ATCC 25205 / DSM 745 / LMG 13164 / NCIMB 1802) TaxID=880070 RepID=G0J6Q5_CYCMS|nr:bifunctional nicotinamidase/pyrazinamidase [Cyclobacterium marinum]AEL28570.1 isochorismatase hydrolase [Cyclobacterium marinum DSM 745]MBI0398416.1 bifunctional nicotinamidase/pyrazinamidase [Cyclobacterium marinum]
MAVDLKNSALIIVDVQNDFLPGGALAVNNGDKVIPVINKLQDKFEFIVATQDWHPATHGSFAGNHEGQKVGDTIILNGLEQILWPSHCVEGSFGAAFHEGLENHNWREVFKKGTNPKVDSYSGFFDNGRKEHTGLGDYLKRYKIEKVFVTGLAADYCVKFTVLDALDLGFQTFLITDATKGVNLAPNDTVDAFGEMEKMGAVLLQSEDLL